MGLVVTSFTLNDAFYLDGVYIPGPGATGTDAGAGAGYTTGAVNLDGSTILSLASLAATDSTRLTYSYWFKDMAAGPGLTMVVDVGTELNFTDKTYLGQPETFASNVPYTGSRIDFFAAAPAGVGWHHVIVCMDLNFADGFRPHAMYVDDVNVTTDDAPHSGGLAFSIIANTKTFNLFGDTFDNVTGNIADIWWGLDQFLDITITSNRRKFISSLGKPVNLGATGSTPTGTAPTFFLRRVPSVGTADDFKTDKSGHANNFTVTGTLTDAATSPTD